MNTINWFRRLRVNLGRRLLGSSDPRIPDWYLRQFANAHACRIDAAVVCLNVAIETLAHPPVGDLQRITHCFVSAMNNSLASLAVLARYGHGADAIRVARGMFENLVTVKYLAARPSEVGDFLDFDCVARWNRQEFYRTEWNEHYSNFPANKKEEVNKEYERVRQRFLGKDGKVRRQWCSQTIRDMARVAHLDELYMIFYPYASALHHGSPMGLGMLIDARTGLVPPEPRLAHVGVALAAGVVVAIEGLKCYAAFHGIDYSAELDIARKKAEEGNLLDGDEEIVSSLASVFADEWFGPTD